MAINFLRWVSYLAHALPAHMSAYAAPSTTSPRKWFRSQLQMAATLVANQASLLPGSPTFDPDWMEKLPSYRQTGGDQPRCYSYGLEKGTEGFIRPGQFADRQNGTHWAPDGAYTPQSLRLALEADGLRSLTLEESAPLPGWVISAFISSDGRDFHFKRLDAHGVVSDKPGLNPLRKLTEDDSAHPRIVSELLTYKNPLTGERYKYVGLYQVIPGVPPRF